MVKKAEQNKLQGHNGVVLEQTSIYDDSLLPPSEELSKLKEVDANIIQWLMDRATKEQDARIKFNEDKLILTERRVKSAHVRSMTGMILLFIIILVGFGLTALFLYMGIDVGATIFGGCSFVSLIIAVVRIKTKE